MSPTATATKPEQAGPVPADVLRFRFDNAVRFVKKGKNGFTIEAYDGGIVPNHWYWGNLAFDMDGLTWERPTTPVFDSHDYDRRIGFSTSRQIRPKVTISGTFLDNEAAQQLRRDMQQGFPMQASLGLNPVEVEQIKKGETAQVNGHTIEGPGAIFRKASIKEVSMAAFGAVPGTSATAFSGEHAPAVVPAAFSEATASEEQLREHFAADQHLRTEFAGNADDYVAFITADREGRVHVCESVCHSIEDDAADQQ